MPTKVKCSNFVFTVENDMETELVTITLTLGNQGWYYWLTPKEARALAYELNGAADDLDAAVGAG